MNGAVSKETKCMFQENSHITHTHVHKAFLRCRFYVTVKKSMS